MTAEESTEGRDEKAKPAGTFGRADLMSDSTQEPRKDPEPKMQYAKVPLRARSKAKQELLESKERLELVLESGQTGTWDWDIETRRVRWNDKLYEMLGISPEGREVTAEEFFHYIHPQDLPRVQENLAQVLNSGTEFEDTFRIVRPDGDVRWLSSRGRLFRDHAGKPLHIMGVNHDVTEEKRAEERLQRENREIALANRILEVFVEEKGAVLYDKVLELLLEEMESRYGVFGYIDEEDNLICPTMSRIFDECDMEDKCICYTRDQWKGLWSRALLEKRTLFTNEAPQIPPGHVTIDNNLAAPILFQGNVIGLFNLANKPGGYTEQDVQFLEAIANRIAPVLYAWIQAELRDKERRQAEEGLRRSEEKFHSLFSTMDEAFVLFELIRDKAGRAVDCRVLDANPAVEKMTGVVPSDAIGRTMRELFPDADDFWFDTYGQVEETGQSISLERRFDPLDRFYHTCIYRPAPGQIAIIFTDITERRRIEEARERNAAQLEATLDSLTEGLVICDLDANLYHWNPAAVAMHGFSSMDECKRKLADFAEIFELSTDQGGVLPLERWPLSRILRGETLRNWEVHLRRRGANWHRIFNYGGRLVRDRQGKPLLAVVSCTDITERKHAADQIQRLAKFPSEDPFPVLRISSGGTILYGNEPALRLLAEWKARVGQEAPPDWRQWVSRALDSGQNVVNEVSSGSRIYSLVATPVVDGGYVNLYGRDITAERNATKALEKAHAELEKKVEARTIELTRAVEILREAVDQRMQAEKSARDRSRVLDAFFSHSVMPLVILDRQFNFVRVNQAYADACERKASEFEGHNHFEFFPHEENHRIFEEVVRTKRSYEAVARPFTFPDHPEWGTTYWDWTLVPILDEAGEVELLVFSLQDVTARRRSELDLEQSEARYRALVELSPDPILVVADNTIVYANASCVELAAQESTDKLIGKRVWNFVHSDSRRMAETLLRAVLRGRKRLGLVEMKMQRPDGHTVDVEVSAAPVRHEGKPAVQAVIRDITERKQAQARDHVTRALLELFVQKSSKKEYLDSVVEVIRTWSNCSHVGIRLTNGVNQIPYASHAGFTDAFLSLESELCLNKDVCVCTRVVEQNPDPQDRCALTDRGSFYCGNTPIFLQSMTEAERTRYRGECIKRGFMSLAIIPICYRKAAIGAIHLADEDRYKVPLENVQFLESMANLIGEAIHKFKVEEALMQSEERFRLLAESIDDVFWMSTPGIEKMLYVSPAYEKIWGRSRESLYADPLSFLEAVHPDDRATLADGMRRHAEGMWDFEYRIVRPDDSVYWVRDRGFPIRDERGNLRMMCGVATDISAHKQAEEQMLADRAALRSLTSELQLAEERQRRRLARDLHDSIGQILAMSKREVVHLQKAVPEQAASSLKVVASQLDEAITEARTLSFELSPSVLYDLGFEVALEELAERFSEQGRIRCRFRGTGGDVQVPEAVGVLLYRSVRELLFNVAKHANATETEILLEKTEDRLYITIQDDGDGFDVSVLDGQSRQPKGFGVLSIRERLRHLGGEFRVESDAGTGTRVTLVVPMDIELISE